MSTVTDTLTPERRGTAVLRGAALVAALLVMASYLSAMYFVVDVVGDPTELLLIVGATLVVATVLSRVLTVRVAVTLSAAMLGVGLLWYLNQLPAQSFAFGPHLQYLMALISGHSILGIINLKAWVLGVTPAPVFLTWYLSLRRHYGAAALVGGLTVGFFILTGDATFPVAMVGSVGALALLGLGALERAEADLGDAEVVSIVLAVVVLVSVTVSFVPQGAALSYSPTTGFVGAGGAAGGNTVEASLLNNGQRLDIKGSIELSPKVRWTVESPVEEYWRVGAYDLYTGDGWLRRGEGTARTGRLGGPPGESRRVTQEFEAESAIATMPAVWRPTGVGGQAGRLALATELNGLKPQRPLQAGESYTVTSQIPIATSARLQQAGTDYPDRIEQRFTQLPDSTPERVTQRTNRLTANARTPYETALTIERWLEDNRDYSLDVEAPGDNVADQFLFERQRGYCVYFATTMAVMLRTQGIPARMAVGYTSGDRVEEDTWVVRGYNSHAWVEAYFPEVGWVRFDPTPAGPREAREGQSLDEAREENETDIDTQDTLNPAYTPPNSATGGPSSGDVPWLNGSNGGAGNFTAGPTPTDDGTDTADNDSTTSDTDTTAGSAGGGEGGLEMPSREEVILGVVAMLGMVAGVRRSGASSRLYRQVWLRWQPREDPETDVERAHERLLYLLGQQERERRPGETVRQYLDAVDADERAREVAAIRERARYGGSVTEADADRAVELVDDVVSNRSNEE